MTPRDWYEGLGARLREAREARRWTQADVGAVADVTAAAVSRWERGLQAMKAHHYVLLRREGLL